MDSNRLFQKCASHSIIIDSYIASRGFARCVKENARNQSNNQDQRTMYNFHSLSAAKSIIDVIELIFYRHRYTCAGRMQMECNGARAMLSTAVGIKSIIRRRCRQHQSVWYTICMCDICSSHWCAIICWCDDQLSLGPQQTTILKWHQPYLNAYLYNRQFYRIAGWEHIKCSFYSCCHVTRNARAGCWQCVNLIGCIFNL